MVFQFGCTDIIQAQWPTPHHTLRWGAASNDPEYVLPVVGVTTTFFWLLMPKKVAAVHTVTFWSVVGTLWVTEGTLALGSKWCTYCLVFSFIYISDGFLWDGGGEGGKVKKK